MSHIFISYARKDQEHLHTALNWLESARFEDRQIWYDKNIEAGSAWSDEIPEALDSAFAVLLILTENSVKREYVIYEWAYALGQGIPVIPFLFDSVEYSEMLVPLRKLQIVDFSDNLPDELPGELVRKLRQLQSTAPEVAAINRLVYEAIIDTHRQFFVLDWMGEAITYFDPEMLRNLTAHFKRNAHDALEQLEELMLEKAFALSGKQYRLCWQLVDVLRQISRTQLEYVGNFGSQLPLSRVEGEFESKWLPAFEYFEGNGWWRKRRKRYFDFELDNDDTQLEIITEATRAFPQLYGRDIQDVIHNKLVRQQRASEEEKNN